MFYLCCRLYFSCYTVTLLAVSTCYCLSTCYSHFSITSVTYCSVHFIVQFVALATCFPCCYSLLTRTCHFSLTWHRALTLVSFSCLSCVHGRYIYLLVVVSSPPRKRTDPVLWGCRWRTGVVRMRWYTVEARRTHTLDLQFLYLVVFLGFGCCWDIFPVLVLFVLTFCKLFKLLGCFPFLLHSYTFCTHRWLHCFHLLHLSVVAAQTCGFVVFFPTPAFRWFSYLYLSKKKNSEKFQVFQGWGLGRHSVWYQSRV